MFVTVLLQLGLLLLNRRATNHYTAMRWLVHCPLMGGLLHLVQQGRVWAGCGRALFPPSCTKCNSPPINGQSTNLIDVALQLPVPIIGLTENLSLHTAAIRWWRLAKYDPRRSSHVELTGRWQRPLVEAVVWPFSAADRDRGWCWWRDTEPCVSRQIQQPNSRLMLVIRSAVWRDNRGASSDDGYVVLLLLPVAMLVP